MITIRENTWDNIVYAEVVNRNDYKLQESLDNYIIIDIGAHIGCFTYACIQRNAKFIYAYEPMIDNYNLACKNLKEYSNVQLNNLAVWRSDLKEMPELNMVIFGENNKLNTGSHNVIQSETRGNKNYNVQTIALDKIIEEIENKYPENKILLKLDCEGSEYPILLTSNKLDKVDIIVGEYHNFFDDGIPYICLIDGYDKFSMNILEIYLKYYGFNVQNNNRGRKNDLFWCNKSNKDK